MLERFIGNPENQLENGVFYELRRYEVVEGKMEEWVQFMEEEIIPFQVAKGMVITGSFRTEDSKDYIWMRRFNSEAEREQLYEAVYQSDEWKHNFADRVGQLINRATIDVKRIVPTPRSVTQ